MISIFLIPMELGSVVMFLTGAVMLIVGMGFFQLGAEMAHDAEWSKQPDFADPCPSIRLPVSKKGIALLGTFC